MEQDANTKSVFNQVAQQYQEKYRDLALYEDGFDLFCSAIEKKAASVLEIACGPGNVSHYLLQQRPDFQLLGIDFAEQMIELARIAHPTATFQVGDAREIRQLAQRFDGILCGFGLPYLSKPEALTLIRDAAELLQPGGILYLSTMEDDYGKSGYVGSSSGGPNRLYTYYHQADYLTQEIQACGLELRALQRINVPQATGDLTTDLILIARKGA